MGLCCCKDWREHLRAPKGNSRCARAPRARDLCASVRSAPPAPSSCGWGLPPPHPGLVCQFSWAARHLPQPWKGLRSRLRTLERASEGCSCSAVPAGAWGRALGGRGAVWGAQWAPAAGPPSSRWGGGVPGALPRPAPHAGPLQREPGQRPAPPLRLNRPGADPFILIRLCHKLGPMGSESEFSESRAGTCEGSCLWNAEAGRELPAEKPR